MVFHNYPSFFVLSMIFYDFRGGGGIHPPPGHGKFKKAQKSLKEMLSFVKPEILCINETKLTSDTTAQFHIEGYHYPSFRRERVQNQNNTHFGGGKIVYVKEESISNRLNKFETEHAENICLELTIKEREWFIMFAYRKH